MTSIEHVGKNAPLDLAKLEADVTAAIPARSLMPINGAPSVQSDPMPDYVKQSRPRKSAQDDKWNFCLTTAIVAVNRRNHEQTTPPEPLTGL